MAKTKKCRKVQLAKEIKNRLQAEFRVSERELVSDSFYLDNDAVLLEDVLPFFESQYDIALKDRSFGNWSEFIETITNLVVCKK